MKRTDFLAATVFIPGAVVVPSMVATIEVLQHGFAYTHITIQS